MHVNVESGQQLPGIFQASPEKIIYSAWKPRNPELFFSANSSRIDKFMYTATCFTNSKPVFCGILMQNETGYNSPNYKGDDFLPGFMSLPVVKELFLKRKQNARRGKSSLQV